MNPTLTVNAKANRGVEQVEKSLFLALKRNGKVYIVVKNGLSAQPVKQENYLKTALGRCGNLESAQEKTPDFKHANTRGKLYAAFAIKSEKRMQKTEAGEARAAGDAAIEEGLQGADGMKRR